MLRRTLIPLVPLTAALALAMPASAPADVPPLPGSCTVPHPPLVLCAEDLADQVAGSIVIPSSCKVPHPPLLLCAEELVTENLPPGGS
jgi:hypothetical protein